MVFFFSSSTSLDTLFRALRPTLSAMSTLASVVSLGSPGSATLLLLPLSRTRSELARCLLLGFKLVPLVVRLVCRDDSGAVVSPSSPEASREDVCCRAPSCKLRSATAAAFLLRLPLWEDPDGDDIVATKK